MNFTDLLTSGNTTGINSGMTPQQTDLMNSLIQSPMWQQMISGQQQNQGQTTIGQPVKQTGLMGLIKSIL